MLRCQKLTVPFLTLLISFNISSYINAQWKYIGPEGGYITKMSIYYNNPDIIYITVGGDIFKSEDGGVSWNMSGDPDGALEFLSVSSDNPSILYASYVYTSRPGLFKSTNI